MRQKFSKHIIADQDVYYMSCPEEIAKHLATQLIHFQTAVELCTAVGMTAIQLAKTVGKVYAVDINKIRIKNAERNAELYEVKDKIEFIVGDVLDPHLLKSLSAEVAILDPDWSIVGAKKSIHVKMIDDTQPNLKELFRLTKQFITSNIVIRIPSTFTFETLSEFGPCKIENIIWDNQIKFKFAYFFDDSIKNSEVNSFFDL